MSDRRFRVSGPAVINVSGGRTSAYMLHQILDAHDGKLPADVIAAFCNTGREMPATLDFIDRVSREWGVRIRTKERDLLVLQMSPERMPLPLAARPRSTFGLPLFGTA